MKSIMMRAWLAAGLVIVSGYVFGHEDFRVIGTVSKYQDSIMDVETRDGHTRSIRVDRQTLITQNQEKIGATALQAGLTVVVDAYGDSVEDLLALEIRIVPPIQN
jgi:hypothetical protein